MADLSDVTEIQERVRRFIVTEVLEMEEGVELPPEPPLLSGLLDSFGLLSLLTYLEETYDITINHSDVVDENFRSVEDVAMFVKRKLASAA